MALYDTQELHRVIALFIGQLEKSYKLTIPKEEKDNIIRAMTSVIKEAGGLDITDPQAVNKMKQGIITCLTTSKTAPQLNKKPIRDVLTLMFRKENTLNNVEKLKLTYGLAYIKALEQNPDLKLDMPLLFKFFEKPESLTPKDRERLSDDLQLVHDTIDDIPEIEDLPELKELSRLVKDLKDKVKDPAIPLDKDFVKQQADNISNLWNGSPQFPQSGNLLSIPVGRPAVSQYSPIDNFAGVIEKDQQGATMGLEVPERQETLGEDIHQTVFSNTDYETMKKLGFLEKDGFKELFKDELSKLQSAEPQNKDVMEPPKVIEKIVEVQRSEIPGQETNKVTEDPITQKTNDNAAYANPTDTPEEQEQSEYRSPWAIRKPTDISGGPSHD